MSSLFVLKSTRCCVGVVLASLLASTISLAQQPRAASPTLAELTRNIALVHQTKEGDAEELIGETAQQLVAFLKAHELPAATAKKMGLDFSAGPEDGAHFRVYMFNYHSGGTRGVVTIPVFQWRNAAGKRFAYRFDGEANFSKIYRLASPGRALYLLLGGDNGDSRCYNDMAYVVELKGDYLLLDYAAFGPKPALKLCNVDMHFDARHQLVRLSLSEGMDYNENSLAQWDQRGKPAPKHVTLKFTGTRFVKAQ